MFTVLGRVLTNVSIHTESTGRSANVYSYDLRWEFSRALGCVKIMLSARQEYRNAFCNTPFDTLNIKPTTQREPLCKLNSLRTTSSSAYSTWRIEKTPGSRERPDGRCSFTSFAKRKSKYVLLTLRHNYIVNSQRRFPAKSSRRRDNRFVAEKIFGSGTIL